MVTDSRYTYGKEVSEMPAGNGTGLMGVGPMTGWAAGSCGGYDRFGLGQPRPWPFSHGVVVLKNSEEE